MKLNIVRAYAGSPKYDMLLSSLSAIFAGRGIELVAEPGNADCRLVVGGDACSMLRNMEGAKKICPVVRMIFRSDIGRNFAVDESVVDFTFIIRDLDINILCPYRQTTMEVDVPFVLDCPGQEEECESDIYVNTGEFLYPDSALFKILRTLNRLTRYKIEVCTRNTNLNDIVNPNITLSDASGSIEERVRRSRIVIGSGYAVLYALRHRKPFIVVGERGYGGMPKEVNILPFYHSFFQGSIGGRLDGALPENLVYEDVANIFANGFDTAPLVEKLSGCISGINAAIADKLKSLACGYGKTDVADLQFNNDYTIIEGNGIYWLLNRFTRCIVARLDADYMAVIRHFYNNKGGSAGFTEKEQTTINDLLKNKVLIKREKSHPSANIK